MIQVLPSGNEVEPVILSKLMTSIVVDLID